MTERELSDLTGESNNFVDRHFDIHRKVAGTNFLNVSSRSGYLSIAYESDRNLCHITIPDIKAKISDTKYGVVVSV